MIGRFLASVIALFVVACGSGSEPAGRFVAQDEGFSIASPDGWSPRRDRGAVIFTSPQNERRTIAIRSVVLADPQAQRKALNSTKIVVEGLPDVTITSTNPVEASLPGVAYELSFVPPGSRERYARTHVVLVGDQHIYHLIETVPARESKRDGLVQSIVASLREEV